MEKNVKDGRLTSRKGSKPSTHTSRSTAPTSIKDQAWISILCRTTLDATALRRQTWPPTCRLMGSARRWCSRRSWVIRSCTVEATSHWHDDTRGQLCQGLVTPSRAEADRTEELNIHPLVLRTTGRLRRLVCCANWLLRNLVCYANLSSAVRYLSVYLPTPKVVEEGLVFMMTPSGVISASVKCGRFNCSSTVD